MLDNSERNSTLHGKWTLTLNGRKQSQRKLSSGTFGETQKVSVRTKEVCFTTALRGEKAGYGT